jgi:hypothetical protein
MVYAAPDLGFQRFIDNRLYAGGQAFLCPIWVFVMIFAAFYAVIMLNFI